MHKLKCYWAVMRPLSSGKRRWQKHKVSDFCIYSIALSRPSGFTFICTRHFVIVGCLHWISWFILYKLSLLHVRLSVWETWSLLSRSSCVYFHVFPGKRVLWGSFSFPKSRVEGQREFVKSSEANCCLRIWGHVSKNWLHLNLMKSTMISTFKGWNWLQFVSFILNCSDHFDQRKWVLILKSFLSTGTKRHQVFF